MMQSILPRGSVPVARKAHNLEVGGSIPPPAKVKQKYFRKGVFLFVLLRGEEANCLASGWN